MLSIYWFSVTIVNTGPRPAASAGEIIGICSYDVFIYCIITQMVIHFTEAV